MSRHSLATLTSAAVLAFAAQAHAATPADPLEKFNRGAFIVHSLIDQYLIRPLALGFKHITPKPVRQGIENFLSNVGEPCVAANDLLQGRFHKFGDATTRLVINSTVGVAGFFDVATKIGVPHHDNGFALTLGRWGMTSGPYLFIPLLGPSTFRDAIGTGVDGLANPIGWFRPTTAETATRIVVGGLDMRANIDQDLIALLSDATDPYATLRSVYLQSMQSRIDDTGTKLPILPDFGDEGGASPPPAAATSPPAQPSGAPDAAPASPDATPAPPADTPPKADGAAAIPPADAQPAPAQPTPAAP